MELRVGGLSFRQRGQNTLHTSDRVEQQYSVVVLEDEAVTRALLVDCLKQLGDYPILEFDSAPAFLDRLQSDPTLHIGVIFTDIEMPKINGVELLRMIRTGSTRLPRDTQVVMISSLDSDTVIGSALALDAADYVVKPFCLNQLQSVLQSCPPKVPNVKPEIAYKVINTHDLTPAKPSSKFLLTDEELAFIRAQF